MVPGEIYWPPVIQRIGYYWERRRVISRTLQNLLVWSLKEPWRRSLKPRTPVVVFIRRSVRSRFRNHARGLKAEGLGTILISSVFNYEYLKGAFDEIHVAFNETKIRQLIRSLSAKYDVRAVISSMQPAKQTADIMDEPRSWPLIVDHQESAWSQFHFLRKENRLHDGDHDWLHPAEAELEKKAYLRVDGVLARSRELTLLFEEERIETPIMLLEDRCDPGVFQPIRQRSRKPGDEISVVYAGMLYPMHLDPLYYHSAQLVPYGPGFAEERVHFHIYPGPHHEYTFEDYEAEARRNPYFHIHRSVEFDQVQKVLAGYDFGLVAFHCPDLRLMSRVHLESTLHAKVLSYLEAGLPVLTPGLFKRDAQVVEETGAGMVMPEDCPRGLRSQLEALDTGDLQIRVRSARERMACPEQGRMLREFIEKLGARRSGGSS